MTGSGCVLIVDDEDFIRTALKRYLSRAGYTVREASSGEDALREVEQEAPDLVILDVMMRGADGFETLEALRDQHTASELPVIMATALDEREHIIRAMRLGANDYAVKPFDMRALVERVGQNVRRRVLGDGDMVAGYRIEEKIGVGGAGTVYRAVEAITERKVALKVLSQQLVRDEEFVARFLREARTMAQVEHPNIVSVHTAGRAGETYFISLELVDGEDLFSLANTTPLPVSRALEIARDIASGLAELHRHEIIHRDIKPENILVDGAGRAVITDFGLARTTFSDEGITGHGMAVGTLPYIAPEQLLGKVDARSDVYSLGASLFYALTGRPPFRPDEEASELIKKKFHDAPRARGRRPELPADVDDFVASLMATEASARPQRFAGIVASLQGLRDLHGA